MCLWPGFLGTDPAWWHCCFMKCFSGYGSFPCNQYSSSGVFWSSQAGFPHRDFPHRDWELLDVEEHLPSPLIIQEVVNELNRIEISINIVYERWPWFFFQVDSLTLISVYTWSQFKRVPSSHIIPIKHGYYQKAENNRSRGGRGDIGTLVPCRWECKMVQLLWKKVGSPSKD